MQCIDAYPGAVQVRTLQIVTLFPRRFANSTIPQCAGWFKRHRLESMDKGEFVSEQNGTAGDNDCVKATVKLNKLLQNTNNNGVEIEPYNTNCNNLVHNKFYRGDVFCEFVLSAYLNIGHLNIVFTGFIYFIMYISQRYKVPLCTTKDTARMRSERIGTFNIYY